MPRIQASLRSGQGHVPSRRWEVSVRRPEYGSDEALNFKFRSSLRGEFHTDLNRNEDPEDTHYSIFMKFRNADFFRPFEEKTLSQYVRKINF